MTNSCLIYSDETTLRIRPGSPRVEDAWPMARQGAKRGATTMQLNPYLTFNGDCAAAFAFYVQCLGGRVEATFTFGESPMANEVPADWHDKVLHTSLIVADRVVMGSDSPPQQYQAPQGISVSLNFYDVAEAERVYQALAEGGEVQMPLQETFWAERFGMLVDRFGIPWMINCEKGA